MIEIYNLTAARRIDMLKLQQIVDKFSLNGYLNWTKADLFNMNLQGEICYVIQS